MRTIPNILLKKINISEWNSYVESLPEFQALKKSEKELFLWMMPTLLIRDLFEPNEVLAKKWFMATKTFSNKLSAIYKSGLLLHDETYDTQWNGHIITTSRKIYLNELYFPKNINNKKNEVEPNEKENVYEGSKKENPSIEESSTQESSSIDNWDERPLF